MRVERCVGDDDGDKQTYLSGLPGGLGCELFTRSFTWKEKKVGKRSGKVGWQKTHLRSICVRFATTPATIRVIGNKETRDKRDRPWCEPFDGVDSKVCRMWWWCVLEEGREGREEWELSTPKNSTNKTFQVLTLTDGARATRI
jgi:hypothetical protein